MLTLTLRKESDTFTFFIEIGAVEDAYSAKSQESNIRCTFIHSPSLPKARRVRLVLRLRRTRRNSLRCIASMRTFEHNSGCQIFWLPLNIAPTCGDGRTSCQIFWLPLNIAPTCGDGRTSGGAKQEELILLWCSADHGHC